MPTASITLPAWAQVSPKRKEHIERVVALLERWASELNLPDDEASRWKSAGELHDALRDAPETMLRTLSGDAESAAEILHGPAAQFLARQLFSRSGPRRQTRLTWRLAP